MYVKTTTKLLTLRPIEVHYEDAPYLSVSLIPSFLLLCVDFDAKYDYSDTIF